MKTLIRLSMVLLSTGLAGAKAATLKFSIPTGENSVGKDQMSKTLELMFNVVKVKTGVTLQLDPIAAYSVSRKKGIPGNTIRMNEYIARLKAGKTDIIGITPEEFFTNPQLQTLLEPGFTWSVNQKKMAPECIYVAEGSSIKSVKDLRGKTISPPTSYVMVRRILAANGINEPLGKFFGKIAFFDDPVVQYQSLIDKKIDAFHETYPGWFYYKNLKPHFKKVKPLACIQNQPLLFFALRKGADKASAQKVISYLMTAHRDPAMGQAKWFFIAFNGSFFQFGMEYLASFKTAWIESEKKGWVAEAKKWHSQEAPARFKAWIKQNP